MKFSLFDVSFEDISSVHASFTDQYHIFTFNLVLKVCKSLLILLSLLYFNPVDLYLEYLHIFLHTFVYKQSGYRSQKQSWFRYILITNTLIFKTKYSSLGMNYIVTVTQVCMEKKVFLVTFILTSLLKYQIKATLMIFSYLVMQKFAP